MTRFQFLILPNLQFTITCNLQITGKTGKQWYELQNIKYAINFANNKFIFKVL